MKKSTLYLIIVLLVPCYTWAYGNCKNFKIGKFVLFDQGKNIHTKVERTASEQIETDIKTGKYIKFKIRWINECEYELTFVDGDSEKSGYFRHRKLVIKITNVYADGYRFEGKVQGSKKMITNILRVL